MKMTLCIRGGGVKSAVAVGVLKILEESSGIEIAGFSGTSIGSVIAALAAAGKKSEDILEFLKENVTLFSNTTRIRGGNGDSIVIEKAIDNELNNITFSELHNNLFVTANSGGLLRTKLFVFSKETTPNITLGQACRASCSFPGLFRRCKIKVNDKIMYFFDGGMVSNPYIPEINDTKSVLVSFTKGKTKSYSYYRKAFLMSEEKADIIIKPHVGNLGTLGTQNDINTAFIIGYININARNYFLQESYP